MVESIPKIPPSQTTTNKEGVNPQKVNQLKSLKVKQHLNLWITQKIQR